MDWRPALHSMRITPAQAAAIVDARAQVTVKLEECARCDTLWRIPPCAPRFLCTTCVAGTPHPADPLCLPLRVGLPGAACTGSAIAASLAEDKRRHDKADKADRSRRSRVLTCNRAAG